MNMSSISILSAHRLCIHIFTNIHVFACQLIMSIVISGHIRQHNTCCSRASKQQKARNEAWLLSWCCCSQGTFSYIHHGWLDFFCCGFDYRIQRPPQTRNYAYVYLSEHINVPTYTWTYGCIHTCISSTHQLLLRLKHLLCNLLRRFVYVCVSSRYVYSSVCSRIQVFFESQIWKHTTFLTRGDGSKPTL